MNDLIISKQSLPPATIDELQEWIIVNKECLNAHKAKIRAIQKMNMAIAAKEAALQDGQRLGDILLDAEVRLGEMLEAIPKQGKTKEYGSEGGTIPTLPPDITKKQSHEAQELFRHGWAVEQAKKEAREEGTIPTSRDVYQKIQGKKKLMHTETHPVSDAMYFVEIAKSHLESIREDDPKREEALEGLVDWIINLL